MTAFAGIVTFDGAPDDILTEDLIGHALATPRMQRVLVHRASGALFVQRTADEPASTQAAPPLAGSDDAILFAADCRLDNRAELGAALALSWTELKRTPSSLLIQQMYRRWGEAGVARCLGAFAFALWDAQARCLILARDCYGDRTLFFHHGKGFVAFASILGALLALPRVPREIDEMALAQFMLLNHHATRPTFYRGIERVPSRTIVTIERTDIRHRHYWAPNFDAPPPYRRDEDYVERARELLDRAVAAVTDDTPNFAIATSGGLDSSAIAATAARLGRAERIDCYCNVPPLGMTIDVGPQLYIDERDKVEALARMYPALSVHFITPEKPHPFETDNTRFFARMQTPVLGAGMLGEYGPRHDAIVSAGHRYTLYGSAGNFGLTWSGRFSLLAMLRAGQWAALAHDARVLARYGRRGLVRTVVGEIAIPAAPSGLRRLLYRMRGRAPDDVARYSALNPDFIAGHNLLHQLRTQGFDPWFGVSGWHPARYRAARLFDFNQVARDFRGMSKETHGYEIRDPLADRRLLEFLLMIPEPMYRRNGVPRSFARAVLADRLPPEVLRELRRGAHNVTWFRSLDARRQDIAADLVRLETSPLARRLIDLPRLKRLMTEWPADEHIAEKRRYEFDLALSRGIHIGRFIRWVEGGNA